MMQSKLFVQKVFNESLVQAERCKFARKQITVFFSQLYFSKAQQNCVLFYIHQNVL